MSASKDRALQLKCMAAIPGLVESIRVILPTEKDRRVFEAQWKVISKAGEATHKDRVQYLANTLLDGVRYGNWPSAFLKDDDNA